MPSICVSFQSEFVLDVAELLAGLRLKKSKLLSPKEVRSAASQISHHLPVVVISTSEENPKCKLVDVHEFVLHPAALYSLLSISSETKADPVPDPAVKFTKQVDYSKCIAAEQLSAVAWQHQSGAAWQIETACTTCFACALCACWKCDPRSFEEVLVDSELMVALGSAEPEPIYNGGLIVSFCLLCKGNRGKCCHRQDSSVRQLFWSECYTAFYNDGTHRWRPRDWGAKYDEDGIAMVFADDRHYVTHGGKKAIVCTHQLFPELVETSVTFLQQHSGHSAEAKRRTSEAKTVGASVYSLKQHLLESVAGLKEYGLSSNSHCTAYV
jgi:hypothetical protein